MAVEFVLKRWIRMEHMKLTWFIDKATVIKKKPHKLFFI